MYNDADLSESRFLDAKLLIDLSESTFADASLTNVSIAASNLSGMKINGVLVSDLIQAYESRRTRGFGAAERTNP